MTEQQQQAQQRDRRGSDTQELLTRLRSVNSAIAAARTTALGRAAEGGGGDGASGSGDGPGSRRTTAVACAEGVEHSALRFTHDALPQPPDAPLPPPAPPPPVLPSVSEITASPQGLSPPEESSPPPPALSRDNSGRKGQGGGSIWSSLMAVAESAARALGGTTAAAAGRLSPTSPSPTSRGLGGGSQHNGRSISGPPGIGGGPDSGSVLLPPMPTLIPSLGGGRLQVLVEESGVSLDEHMIASTNAPPPPPTCIGSGYARRSSLPYAFVPSLRRSLSPPHRSDAYGDAAAAAASAVGDGPASAAPVHGPGLASQGAGGPPPVPFRTGQGGYGHTAGPGPSPAYAGSTGWGLGAPRRPSNSAAGLPDFCTASGESDSDGYSYSMRRLSSQGSRKIRGILKSGSMSAVSPVPQAPQPIVWVTNGRGGRASSSDGSGVFLRATFSGGSGTSTPVRPAYQHRALPGVPPPPTAYPVLPANANAAAGGGIGGASGGAGGAGMSRAQGFAAGLRIQLPPDEPTGPRPGRHSGNTSPLQPTAPTPSSAGSVLSPGSLPTPRHPPPYRGASFNRRVSFTPDVSDSECRPPTQNATRSMSGPPVLPVSGDTSAPSPPAPPPGGRPSFLTLLRTGSAGSTSSVGGAAPGWAHQSSMERRQARRPPQLEKIPSLPGSPSAPGSPSHGTEPPLAPRGAAMARRLDSCRSLISMSSTGRPRSRKPGMVPTYSTVIKILVSYAQVLSILRKVSLQLPRAIREFMAVTNSLSYSVSSFVSLDCSLDASAAVPVSVQRTFVSLAVPPILAIAAFLLWLLLYVRLRIIKPRAPSFAEYMDTRFVTTAIVIVFYCYPGITDTLLSIYSCPRLDNDDPGLPYHGLGRAVGVYWEEDYDMRCFAGWHRALALGLGVPGVLLFSCGVPAASAAFLAMRRAQLETDMTFGAKWGFVYGEYRPRFFFWESVVMLRKLLMVVVIVYVGYVGEGVQVLVAMGVLITAMVVQLLFAPFREPFMNTLERVSLYATCATLYASLFFLIDGVGEVARTVLSILIMAGNGLVVLFFVACIGLEFVRHCVREYDLNGDGRLSWAEIQVMLQEKFGDNAAGRAVLWLAKRLAKRVGVLSRSVSASVRTGAGMLARVSSSRVGTPRTSMGDSYRSLRVRKRSNTSTLYDRTLSVEP